MNPLNVSVLGAAGRMGRALIAAICADDRFNLAGALVRAGSVSDGHDAGTIAGLGEVGVAATSHLPTCDVVVDFSTPSALLGWLPELQQSGVALVSGTTGLNPKQQRELTAATDQIAVLQAANMSLGVQLLYQLAAQAAAALGPVADIEISEVHHRQKKDAPSGTALALGRQIAASRQQDFDAVAKFARHGPDGARREGEIGFSVLRAGDVVGQHTVMFGMAGEQLELSHRAGSRAAFVGGALQAAAFLAGQPPGQYSLADLLSPGSA